MSINSFFCFFKVHVEWFLLELSSRSGIRKNENGPLIDGFLFSAFGSEWAQFCNLSYINVFYDNAWGKLSFQFLRSLLHSDATVRVDSNSHVSVNIVLPSLRRKTPLHIFRKSNRQNAKNKEDFQKTLF